MIEQLHKLKAATDRDEAADPSGLAANANVKLSRALSQLILEAVPGDPAREEYRQGNTMGTAFRHWRRAKIGRRFRLFFRYDSKAKVIILPGSTMRVRYVRQAVNLIPTRYSKKC